MKRLALTFLAALLGCGGWEFGHDKLGNRPPSSEPAVSLGLKHQIGYHTAPNASFDDVITKEDLGFVVGGSGAKSWRINFTDTFNLEEVFSGTVTTDGAIDNVSPDPSSVTATLNADKTKLEFSSRPGAAVHSVTFTTAGDVIYFEGSAKLMDKLTDFNIYFVGKNTNKPYVSTRNPVAFICP